MSGSSKPGQNFRLHLLHFPRAASGAIIESVEMKQAMDDVQPHLAYQRISKSARISFGHRNAEKNLAVLERQHVGWPTLMKKLAMQLRHPPIGNEHH